MDELRDCRTVDLRGKTLGSFYRQHFPGDYSNPREPVLFFNYKHIPEPCVVKENYIDER